jgi:hypothetical protein
MVVQQYILKYKRVTPFAILAYPENDRLERAGCMDQILLSTAKKWYANFQTVEIGFQTADSEKNKCLWVVFHVE